MAWTNYQKFLALLMVVTGSINTLAASWADKIEATNSEGGKSLFNHPFLQACAMFLGELSCLFVFKIMVCSARRKGTTEEEIGNSNFNRLIFLAPALCDMTATSIMYVGLNLTYASSFQMLRGSVIVFTGLLSVAFLDRHLKKLEWIGIGFVILGLLCVGLSDAVFSNSSDGDAIPSNNILTGDMLIVMAQIIVATQMVVEEKFVMKHNVPPLLGVGWEGLFGFVILSLLLIPMYFIKVGHTIFKNPGGRMEDALDGFVQMSHSWQICVALAGTVVSIAFFNFAGLSVTKEMSATTRMVLDSIRTFVVWAFSLAVRWQKFQYLQLIGFIILSIGMCLYNDVILRPLYEKLREEFRKRQAKSEPFLRYSDEESTSPLIKSTTVNA